MEILQTPHHKLSGCCEQRDQGGMEDCFPNVFESQRLKKMTSRGSCRRWKTVKTCPENYYYSLANLVIVSVWKEISWFLTGHSESYRLERDEKTSKLFELFYRIRLVLLTQAYDDCSWFCLTKWVFLTPNQDGLMARSAISYGDFKLLLRTKDELA